MYWEFWVKVIALPPLGLVVVMVLGAVAAVGMR